MDMQMNPISHTNMQHAVMQVHTISILGRSKLYNIQFSRKHKGGMCVLPGNIELFSPDGCHESQSRLPHAQCLYRRKIPYIFSHRASHPQTSIDMRIHHYMSPNIHQIHNTQTQTQVSMQARKLMNVWLVVSSNYDNQP